MDSEVYVERQKIQNSQDNFEGEEQSWRLKLPKFKTYSYSDQDSAVLAKEEKKVN